MSGAPGEVDDGQLNDLSIAIVKKDD
jgi:hypothetical protein